VELILENGIQFTKQTGNGVMVAANGNSFEFAWWVKQSLLNGSYFGKMTITPGSGTGKFQGSSGLSDIVGGYHKDGIGVWFKTNGYLVYK